MQELFSAGRSFSEEALVQELFSSEGTKLVDAAKVYHHVTMNITLQVMGVRPS